MLTPLKPAFTSSNPAVLIYLLNPLAHTGWRLSSIQLFGNHMFPIDHPTAVAVRPPRFALGTFGWFTEGSPSGGIPFTIATADWFNMIQAEFLALLTAAGIDPDKEDDGQILAAVQALATSLASAQATESVQGSAKVATAAQARALTSDLVMLTPLKLDEAYKGSRQSLTVNGYQLEPGGLIKQWGITAAIGVEGSTVVTLPIPFPAAFFGALAVPIGTAGSGVTAGVVDPIDLASFTLHSDSSGGGASHLYYWEARGK